ncbi:MAG: hypothetical protein JXA28_10610, partial [Bacteroidetes bacterium]|nr:hypothetical protein [Bacteroidota bacterium]
MRPCRLFAWTAVFFLFASLPIRAQGNIDWEELWKHVKPFAQNHPMSWMNDSLSFTGIAYDETRDVLYVVSPHRVNNGGIIMTEPRIFILSADSGHIRTDIGRSAHPSRMGLGGELPVPLDTMNATVGGNLGFAQNRFALYRIDVDDEGRIYACNLVNPLWGICILTGPSTSPCDPDYLHQGAFRVWRWETPTSSPELIYATLNSTADAIGNQNSSEMSYTRWGDAFAVAGKRGWHTPSGGPPVLRDSVRIYVSGGIWGGASAGNNEIAVLVEDTRPEAFRPDGDVPGGGKLSFRLGVTIQLPIVAHASHGIAPGPLTASQGNISRELWINRNGGPVTCIEEFQSGTQSLPQTWSPPGQGIDVLPITLTGPAGPLAFFDLHPMYAQKYIVMADGIPSNAQNPLQANNNTTARIVNINAPQNAYRVFGATPITGSRLTEAIEAGNYLSDVDVKIHWYDPIQAPDNAGLHVVMFVLMGGNGIAAYRDRGIPVVLTSFTGNRTTSGVRLRWHVESEQQALHFRISRADGQGAGYRVIGTVPARGTT